MARTSTRVWLAFGLLALAWGSSYLWIKIGLGSLSPLTLIAGRLMFGAAFLDHRGRASPARSCRAAGGCTGTCS